MKKLLALLLTITALCLWAGQAGATVASTDNKIIYTGDDETTVFPYTFKIFDDTDLVVTLVTTATGAEETQTITTDYTVSGAGEAEGGNVTMVTAPASTEQLVIHRVLPMTQGTDLVDNTSFSLEVLEEGYDRLVMISQQLDERLDRTLQAGYTSTVDLQLPSPVATQLLGWNAAGDAITTYEAYTGTETDTLDEVAERDGETDVDIIFTGDLTISGDIISDLNVKGDLVSQTYNFAVDAEADDDYVITLDPAPDAYVTGMMITFKANTANTGACTVEVNELGAKSLKMLHDQTPGDNYIESGSIVVAVYDGTNFQMIQPAAN